MTSSSGKDKNFSNGAIYPYESFLGHIVVVRPMKGRVFDARLVALTPDAFVFEGNNGQRSIYARLNVRSMIDRGRYE
jgi:hypothetical protein